MQNVHAFCRDLTRQKSARRIALEIAIACDASDIRESAREIEVGTLHVFRVN